MTNNNKFKKYVLIDRMNYPIDEHNMHILKKLSCLVWLLYKQIGSNSMC